MDLLQSGLVEFLSCSYSGTKKKGMFRPGAFAVESRGL